MKEKELKVKLRVEWDSILDTIPSEEFYNGQNTERNQ